MTALHPRLSPAPRSLAPSLTVRVLFGSFVGQFGWLFFAFGMLFVWVFDAGAVLTEWVAFRGRTAMVEGTVTDWRSTNMRINDVEVYETSYSFRLPDGRTASGVSFATGSWAEEGETVTVEYAGDDGSASRIVGMRRSPGGGVILFVFIFPLVGFTLGAGSLAHRLRTLRLMKTGTLTTGTLRSIEPTNSRVNEQPVMRLTFEFEADGGGTFNVVAKTHQPARLQDEAQELLVYDARNPASATVLDELPCQPRITPEGDFEASASRFPAALSLLLPGVSLLTALRYGLSLL
ncbi:MAG: DUF3592 domain-containing protein [Gemmatimonadetes bacterium]|nr:DUF3592 domain-containing protein [Gemmatimonadota bacterium]